MAQVHIHLALVRPRMEIQIWLVVTPAIVAPDINNGVDQVALRPAGQTTTPLLLIRPPTLALLSTKAAFTPPFLLIPADQTTFPQMAPLAPSQPRIPEIATPFSQVPALVACQMQDQHIRSQVLFQLLFPGHRVIISLDRETIVWWISCFSN
jgi:hypothetical protein